jgi:hypothetical protein
VSLGPAPLTSTPAPSNRVSLPQAQRRQTTQPSTPPDRRHPTPNAPTDHRLHRASNPRREKPPRRHPLPQTLPRPKPLPTPRKPAADDLTNIEAPPQRKFEEPASGSAATEPGVKRWRQQPSSQALIASSPDIRPGPRPRPRRRTDGAGVAARCPDSVLHVHRVEPEMVDEARGDRASSRVPNSRPSSATCRFPRWNRTCAPHTQIARARTLI